MWPVQKYRIHSTDVSLLEPVNEFGELARRCTFEHVVGTEPAVSASALLFSAPGWDRVGCDMQARPVGSMIMYLADLVAGEGRVWASSGAGSLHILWEAADCWMIEGRSIWLWIFLFYCNSFSRVARIYGCLCGAVFSGRV